MQSEKRSAIINLVVRTRVLLIRYYRLIRMPGSHRMRDGETVGERVLALAHRAVEAEQ